jgi:predicted transcriptional regulator
MLITAAKEEISREQLQAAAGLKDREHFRKAYLNVLLDSGLLEMTIPGKPRSSKQRYRLTALGRQFLEQQDKDRS